MSKALKTTEVTMNYCGKERKEEVGYYIRKRPTLENGKWVDSEENEVIFGLCHGEYVTYMSYGLLVSGVDTWEDFAIKSKHARKFAEFYFDAGSRPLYIMYDELRRVMVELGLISAESITPCEGCSHPKAMHDKSTGGECTKILDEEESAIAYCMCPAFGPKELDDVGLK